MTHQQKLQLIRQLSTRDGFTKKFYEYLGQDMSQKDAFDKLNTEYEQLFGKPRYANYDSYRKAREYHLKKKKSTQQINK